MINKTGNIGFGNLTGLRSINTTTTTTATEQEDNTSTTNNQQYNDTNTKIMKITLHTFERLKEHSRRHYNIESYDTIIKDLLDCYDKHNNTK